MNIIPYETLLIQYDESTNSLSFYEFQEDSEPRLYTSITLTQLQSYGMDLACNSIGNNVLLGIAETTKVFFGMDVKASIEKLKANFE